MKLAMIKTKIDPKKPDKEEKIKYRYWTDDDGDKFTIVQQSPLMIKFTLVDGKPVDPVDQEKISFEQENYDENQTFTAPVMQIDMAQISYQFGGGRRRKRSMKRRSRKRLGGGKKLSAKDCKEKNGYPTRPMQVCVLVNEKRK